MTKIKASSIITLAFLAAVATTGAGIYQAERTAYLASQHAPPQQYATAVDAWAQQGVATPAAREDTTREGQALTFGPTSGTRTLVLYGTGGAYAAESELSATSAAQLATHFGPVTTLPLRSYTPGLLDRYDALLYVGVSYEPTLPAGLADDIVTGDAQVVWAGSNVQGLAGSSEGGTQEDARRRFVAKYGWDASASKVATTDLVEKVRYKQTDLLRASPGGQGTLIAPHILDAEAVDVLAEGVCTDTCRTPDHSGDGTVPWAIRSGNLTYVGESPFRFPVENGHHLAYADLLYAALGDDVEPVRQAAVRLEDVSPNSDPARIRQFAEYLHGEGVPFQIAVVPNFVDRPGTTLGGRPRNLTLADTPDLVEALRYAQSKGATLIQHGTTHQYDSVANPYAGATGDDFEFYRAACVDSDQGAGRAQRTYRACEKDTDVALVGPIGQDDAQTWATRIAGGRALFGAAGLEAPAIFETPHYAASTEAYRGMRRVYDTRYERGMFTDGLLSGTAGTGAEADQIFPYRVIDVHGSVILPENLGSVAPESYSGHAQRSPEEIVEAARTNLVVRESTASFFYHPFLPWRACSGSSRESRPRATRS
ncbi:DUF2334 domain-containing protein [Mobilicoccus caccae]|uniref:DUF2334 domain-containing protein n=1 Tax=Mobilicoccus caccae TaxID=1859295 RepID=A0ABQ6IMY8_9MICO|nr:DUF2334 domain-containing protein [Mobilicoccus caccae]GMA38700.1 hypothetical protein GCM10025883_07450 [Mobilicoccus caccae]